MPDTAPRAGDVAGSRFVLGCAQEKVNDLDPRLAAVPGLPVPDDVRQRMEDGLAFEATVFGTLSALHGLTNLREATTPESATLHAMAQGAHILIGPQLPVVEHMAARPDVLIRHGETPGPDGRWKYLPVDVKHSRPLESGSRPCARPVSPLEAPWLDKASVRDIGRGTPKEDHGLQLAHYWRALEALGHTPDIGPVGGTINPDIGLVWWSLDEGPDSLLALHQTRWQERWAAVNAVRDGGTPKTRPFQHGNCKTCGWREHCGAILEREQHVSLLAGVGEAAVTTLAAAGIHTIPELAALDLSGPAKTGLRPTATLIRAADAARVRMSGMRVPFLPRGKPPLAVPRADVEIDFDIENDDIVYLYGCHVSQRVSDTTWGEGEFLSFHSFDRTNLVAVEGQLLARFWSWLHDTIASVRAEGRTVAVYCYAGGFAEIARMQEAAVRCAGVEGVPTSDQVAALPRNDWWVDIHEIAKSLHWPVRNTKLKALAPLAGFAWTTKDADGAQSMGWYRIAADPGHPEREAHAAKLLRYNADDVLATKALRQFLDDGAAGRGWSLEPVETLSA